MARPREFDMDEVLDAALDAFWDRGFEATSMADLMEVTGLHKGSIYKAFGSKHDLFTQALTRYLDGSYEQMKEVLGGAASARDGVRRWMDLVLNHCGDGGRRRGCLAVNAIVELGPHDEETEDRVRKHFGRVERLLASTIARGQERGELRSDKAPRELAEFLFLVVKGMLASAKGTHSKVGMQRSADLAMEALV